MAVVLVAQTWIPRFLRERRKRAESGPHVDNVVDDGIAEQWSCRRRQR
jgi:hypothetical protein